FFLLANNSLATEYYGYDTKQMKAYVNARQSLGRKIGNFILTDHDGIQFNLKDYLGKPLLINLVYTNCPNTCSVNASIIANSIKELGRDLDEKVNIITIGFDYERDTPQRMKEYGEAFTKDFKYWRFAAGDKKTIERLTNELGFYYKKEGEGFDHLNMISIIDTNGKVYKHIIYSNDEEIKKAQEELIAALEKLLSDSADKKDFKNIGLLEKIRLLCSEYDPTTLQYKFSYYYFITKFILGNILFFILPLFVLWRREILSLVKGGKGAILRVFKIT
ncbi:MAG: SCO family protein, partial [Nitrospinae bacterium]|nr:SCO family protein [Nitrospinota bacterium]